MLRDRDWDDEAPLACANSQLLGLMRHYPKEVRYPGTAVMLWLVFSLAAGFAHAAGATELNIDYLRGFHGPQ
jgi:hypothetical protein